jgi:hypothetical protein
MKVYDPASLSSETPEDFSSEVKMRNYLFSKPNEDMSQNKLAQAGKIVIVIGNIIMAVKSVGRMYESIKPYIGRGKEPEKNFMAPDRYAFLNRAFGKSAAYKMMRRGPLKDYYDNALDALEVYFEDSLSLRVFFARLLMVSPPHDVAYMKDPAVMQLQQELHSTKDPDRAAILQELIKQSVLDIALKATPPIKVKEQLSRPANDGSRQLAQYIEIDTSFFEVAYTSKKKHILFADGNFERAEVPIPGNMSVLCAHADKYMSFGKLLRVAAKQGRPARFVVDAIIIAENETVEDATERAVQKQELAFVYLCQQ